MCSVVHAANILACSCMSACKEHNLIASEAAITDAECPGFH